MLLELFAIITGIAGLVFTGSIRKDVQIIGYVIWVFSNLAWLVMAFLSNDAAHGALFFVYLLGTLGALWQRRPRFMAVTA